MRSIGRGAKTAQSAKSCPCNKTKGGSFFVWFSAADLNVQIARCRPSPLNPLTGALHYCVHGTPTCERHVGTRCKDETGDYKCPDSEPLAQGLCQTIRACGRKENEIPNNGPECRRYKTNKEAHIITLRSTMRLRLAHLHSLAPSLPA